MFVEMSDSNSIDCPTIYGMDLSGGHRTYVHLWESIVLVYGCGLDNSFLGNLGQITRALTPVDRGHQIRPHLTCQNRHSASLESTTSLLRNPAQVLVAMLLSGDECPS